uniref:Centrosomal protein of 44 kDa n=1 Tax=Pogona vitticeps TaxID=103695 RepID=A0ABM5GIQ4_9SAUR
MATGDLKGNLRKIEQGLRLLNYPRDVDYTGLAKGDPSVFLPIISYCFTSFSTYITELLVESDVELTAKNDLRFLEAVYKVLRDQFHYKPVLSKHQFLQYGFAERKIQLVCEIISSVYKRHKELDNVNKVKSQTRKRSHSGKPQPTTAWANPVAVCPTDFHQDFLQTEKPHVECHRSLLDARISEEIIRDALEEDDDDDDVGRTTDGVNSGADSFGGGCEQVLNDNNEVKKLKSQIAELEEKINKLNVIEDKLQVLEEKLQGRVVIDEKDWNNLLSRVLLLETQLLLQSKKDDLSTEFNNMGEENNSSRNRTAVSPDKEKEDQPENLHQSSGYSSQLSVDPSPKALFTNDHALSDVSDETTIQRMERISKMIEETSELLKASSNTS